MRRFLRTTARKWPYLAGLLALGFIAYGVTVISQARTLQQRIAHELELLEDLAKLDDELHELGLIHRVDLSVRQYRLLGDPAYRQRMWAACRAQGAVPSSAKDFIDRLYRSTARPVYLSPALGRSVVAPYASQLFATGMALRLSQAPIDNMARLQANWPRMSRTTTAGPLSQNYLMVGAVLLRHYREIGDEAKAAALEHELRGMARTLGATDRMIRLGVFEH